MVKILTAYTAEIDEAEGALAEILEQIDLNGLRKNSVGIVSCHSEFIATGILRELSEKLPFDVIGATTMSCATAAGYGMYSLSLTVLTSDDVTFETAVSAPLYMSDYEKTMTDAYDAARQKLAGEPSLVISFFPLSADLSGAVLLERLNTLCGGAPIFGGLSSDVLLTQENCFTFKNGDGDKRAAAFLLMHGEVKPQFIVSSLPDRNVSKQKATVTEAEGCVLKKVNGVPLMEYLKERGVLTRADSGISAVNVPLVVDYGNGSRPVALRVYNVFENGDALIGGAIPVGATISIGQIDHDGIMGTSREALERISAVSGDDGVLIFTCVSRFLMLSPDREEEIREITATVGDKTPYSVAYVAGELCPIYGEDGKTYNKMHNYSCVACVF
ncbi:MAG: FIST C-terminal domain-containing protein [Oscillospiraceae bacterium]|nr:FIST C-terminal domain-containing protein [Oscillospiraceae bacterium]